jgi:DNA primase
MTGLIPPATLEQIRAASDIVDVIGAALPLKHAGANFVALCPFHKEKTPSFHVNPQRQIFHCFGCHKGGDVFTFIKEYENISFLEAVRRLAERARIPLAYEENPAAQQTQFLKETLLKIHEQLAQRWQAALANDAAGQIARDYLARRGVPAEAVKLFRLGYAPDAWDDTVNWARSRGFDLATVEQAGLIIRKEAEGGGPPRHYDRFRGRLMFPICDEQGRVIAFSGRILTGDEKTAKYVNSPETPIFTKGRVMFGLDKSKRAILDAGCAIICEGQLDLIACFMAGVQNVVAPQGTALTPDHCRILKRYVPEVVLCFDADAAGQNATLRALDALLGSGLAIRVATVPAPHDPDSFIKERGGEAFRELIQRAAGFFDHLLHWLITTNDPGSDRGRAAIVRAMGEAVAKTGDAVLVDTYAQKTAQRLGVSVEAVRTEFRKTARAAREPGAEAEAEAGPVVEEMAPPSPAEAWLLKLLLLDDSLAPWAAVNLDLDWFLHPVVRRIVELRLAAERADNWQGVAALLGVVGDDATAQQMVTESVAENRELKNRPQQLVEHTRRLRDQFIDRQLVALGRQIADPTLSAEQHAIAFARQPALRQAKQVPLPPFHPT